MELGLEQDEGLDLAVDLNLVDGLGLEHVLDL